MTINKKSIIITIITILIIMISLINLDYFVSKLSNITYDKNKCFNFPEDNFWMMSDSQIINCIGYVYIEKINQCDDIGKEKLHCFDSIYAINNDEIFAKVNEYRVINNIIYIYGQLEVQRLTYGDGEKSISFVSTKDGKKNFIDFIDESDIPKYIIINSQTSDFTLYKTYDEMPENDKKIFRELEQKNNNDF